MGIALGDFYLLNERFAGGKKSRKDLLNEFLDSSRKPKSSQQRKRPTDLLVHFVWFHFDVDKGRYAQVRIGGGKRTKTVNRNIQLGDLLVIATKLFFPNGSNSKGYYCDMKAHLAGIDMKEILPSSSDWEAGKFTVDNYLERYGLKIAKFHLMTKKKSIRTTIRALSEKYIDTDTDDELFEIPTFNATHSTARILQDSLFTPSSSSTQVMDSTEEKPSDIISQQDKEFGEALKSDREKEKKHYDNLTDQLQINEQERIKELRQNMEKLEKKENVRKARQDRLIPEPDLTEESEVIAVNHPTFGKIKRCFHPSNTMQSVYDWVGSLALEPVYFKLSDAHSMAVIELTSKINLYSNTILSMLASDEPLENDKNESVTFAGHHVDFDAVYKELDERRIEHFNNLSQVIKTIYVRRCCVMDDLLDTYQNDFEIKGHVIAIKFEDEDASGDGVAREAFSIFVQDLLLKSFEGKTEFVPIIQAEFGEEEFLVVGEIFYHFFVCFGIFPIQVCRAALEHMFLHDCPYSTLMSSFLAFLPGSEAEVVRDTVYGGKFVREKVIDVLSYYGIRTNPSKSNVRELIVKAAKTELITKPLAALKAIGKPFETFFHDLGRNALPSIYYVASPTNEKVREYVSYPVPVDKMEERTFTYLRRFLDESNTDVLRDFLRFVSGCSFILPGLIIAVTTQMMNDLEARPMARICIKTLVLPRNFQTYHAFENNLKFYLNHFELWVLED